MFYTWKTNDNHGSCGTSSAMEMEASRVGWIPSRPPPFLSGAWHSRDLVAAVALEDGEVGDA